MELHHVSKRTRYWPLVPKGAGPVLVGPTNPSLDVYLLGLRVKKGIIISPTRFSDVRFASHTRWLTSLHSA